MNFKNFEIEYLALLENITRLTETLEGDEEITEIFGYFIDRLVEELLEDTCIENNDYTFSAVVNHLLDGKSASECFDKLQM